MQSTPDIEIAKDAQSKPAILIATIDIEPNISNVKKTVQLPLHLKRITGIIVDGVSTNVNTQLTKLPDNELDICTSFALSLESPLLSNFDAWIAENAYYHYDTVDSENKPIRVAYKYAFSTNEELSAFMTKQGQNAGNFTVFVINTKFICVDGIWSNYSNVPQTVDSNLQKAGQRYYTYSLENSGVIFHKLFAVEMLPDLKNYMAGELSISRENGEMILSKYGIQINGESSFQMSAIDRNEAMNKNSALTLIYRDSGFDNELLIAYKVVVAILYEKYITQ